MRYKKCVQKLNYTWRGMCVCHKGCKVLGGLVGQGVSKKNVFVSWNVIKTDFNEIWFEIVIWILPRWGSTAVFHVCFERLHSVATWYFLITSTVHTVWWCSTHMFIIFKSSQSVYRSHKYVQFLPSHATGIRSFVYLHTRSLSSSSLSVPHHSGW